MSDYIDIQNQDFSFIGLGSKLNGDFYFNGITHLASHLKGTINMEDSSDLFFTPSANIEGKVVCHNLKIYGHFKGEIKATGTVSIFPSASFEGSIEASNLSIHPGSSVNMNGKTLI